MLGDSGALPDEGERAERQRAALRRFMETHRLRAHPWAEKAGVSSGSLYAFLKGTSSSLSLPVAQKLAEVVGASVSAMLGEEEPPLPDTAPITHSLRGHAIIPLGRPPRRRAPTPRDARLDALRVAEVQDAGPAGLLPAGSLVYWHEQPRHEPEALLRRICIISLADGRTILGDLRRGWGQGRHLVVCPTGEVIEDAEVAEARPVEWIKPA